MFQLRRILLSGLVALLMVGMVTAGDVGELPGGDEVERCYIGTWTGSRCIDSLEWQCVHLEFTAVYDVRIPV